MYRYYYILVSLSYNNYRMVHPSMQHCESELQDYEAEEQPESDDSGMKLGITF